MFRISTWTVATAILHNVLVVECGVEDIGSYRDQEYFIELPYVYVGYLDSKLTPEIAVEVVVAPCEEQDAGCCDSNYGVMEYHPDFEGGEEYQPQRMCLYEGRTYPMECLEDYNGELMAYQDLRLSDYDIYFDEDCTDEGEPNSWCVGQQVGRTRAAVNPPCWDHNDTIDSRTATCRLENGTEVAYCLEFAFATNGFVMECRGEYESDLTCGTYVELHRVGFDGLDEELYMAQTKMPQGLHTGYNDVRGGIDLTLFGGLEGVTVDGSVTDKKILCRGNYELWWVQRTRYKSFVLYKKPFAIINPVCDWSLQEENYQLFTAEQNLYVIPTAI